MRELRGWSQAELARRANVDGAHISRIEGSEYSSPRLPTLEKLARALNSTVDEIIGKDEVRQPTIYESRSEYRQLIDLLETREPAARTEAMALFRRLIEHLPAAAGGGEVLEFIPPMERNAEAGVFRIAEAGPGYQVWPDEADFIVGDFDYPRPLHAIVVPQAAELAAGPPREPDDTSLIPTAQVLHSLKEIRDERVRVIKVFGDSMHPLLQNGWKVLLDTTRQTWRPGEIVAAYIRDGGSAIGIFDRDGEQFLLRKHNPQFETVVLPAGEWYPIGVITTIVEAPVMVG